MWPREAAALAGKVRRPVEESEQFRQVLVGTDDKANLLRSYPVLSEWMLMPWNSVESGTP
jgi:hypothetical protein